MLVSSACSSAAPSQGAGRVTCGEQLPSLRRCTAGGAINYVQAGCHKAIGLKSKPLVCPSIPTALSHHT